MTMAYVLEYAQEYFRAKYSWKSNQCGVQFDALPPAEAGPFFVAIDDGGVEAGDDRTASLKEIINITIGIWRKPEHLAQKDRKGNLALPLDKYLIGAYTLHDLERLVIAYNPNEKSFGLHDNWVFMNELNTRYNLPGINGGQFATPLRYRGRGRMEFIGIESSTVGQDAQPYFGFRLRFRGLLREQVTNNSSYSLG